MYKFGCFLFLTVLLVGCGGSKGPNTVDAMGVVTFDGAPVEKANVVFINGSVTAAAITDSQGNFVLRHENEKDGAVPGNYQVQVSKTIMKGGGAGGEGGSEISLSHGLPQKYSSVVTSGLTQTVPDSGIKDIKIELKK